MPNFPGEAHVTNARAPGVAESSQSDAYYCEIPNDPCVVVMFGASGDLARRKVLPALYDLAKHACLAPRFRLLGFARSKMTDDTFRTASEEFLPKEDGGSANGSTRRDFLQNLHY